MRFEFNRLVFETPRIVIHLWSPWRCSQLEHQLFHAVTQVKGVQPAEATDEQQLILKDERVSQQALLAILRTLKGWQEEAEAGAERRVWRWLIEGDMDEAGYDHNGEPASLWCFLRVGLERGGLGEPEKGEDVDLDGFGLEITGRGPSR
jgi:hypothetical protein